MGKFDELLETYVADMKKKSIGGAKIDKKVLHGAANLFTKKIQQLLPALIKVKWIVLKRTS